MGTRVGKSVNRGRRAKKPSGVLLFSTRQNTEWGSRAKKLGGAREELAAHD